MRGQMNRRQENSSAILRPFLSVKETFASNLFPLTHHQLLPFGFPMMRFCIELSFPRFTEVTLSCMESFHPGGVASSRVLIYLNQVFLSPCGFLSRLALHFLFLRETPACAPVQPIDPAEQPVTLSGRLNIWLPFPIFFFITVKAVPTVGQNSDAEKVVKAVKLASSPDNWGLSKWCLTLTDLFSQTNFRPQIF